MTSISVFRALLLATLWAIIPVAGAVDEKEAKPADPKQLVADSWQTLGNFLDDEKHVQFREQLPQAKAILIVPRLVRGGFILGGSGGRGVVLTQDAKSKGWSQPAFVSVFHQLPPGPAKARCRTLANAGQHPGGRNPRGIVGPMGGCRVNSPPRAFWGYDRDACVVGVPRAAAWARDSRSA